jgi:hypothetical protein
MTRVATLTQTPQMTPMHGWSYSYLSNPWSLYKLDPPKTAGWRVTIPAQQIPDAKLFKGFERKQLLAISKVNK